MSSFRFIKVYAVVSVLLAGLASSCSKTAQDGKDPEKQLSDYISKSFSVGAVSDRPELAAYLTGEARRRLMAWSDDQFSEAFIETKRKFLRLVYNEVKPINDKALNITYELTYLDQTASKNTKVTNKKLCMLELQNGRWFIADVKNIKETVEYQNEMSLP